jgi:hypothetical protein
VFSASGLPLILAFALSSFFAAAYTLIIYATPNQGQATPACPLVSAFFLAPATTLLAHAWFLVFAMILFF